MKYYVVVVIILLILGVLFISHDNIPTNIVEEEKVNGESRIEIIEDGTGFTIFYDKVTSVVYFAPDRGGISPMYNTDGSLYLYGSVG